MGKIRDNYLVNEAGLFLSEIKPELVFSKYEDDKRMMGYSEAMKIKKKYENELRLSIKCL